ncbi:methyltransferase [Lentisalinibacter salinarum]|uniref:methyltransferase n=1 Tax=Lentisalinibacter salinarum TaxID=2992239 RepID=UPI00386AD5FB
MARQPVPALRDRLAGWRDALLANPRFQRWAAAFPLTRPIARRRARELFDLCAGFVYSQVLLACVELDLFERLAEGPRDGAALARDCDLPESAATRLFGAAVSLRLLSRRPDGRYALGPLGAALRGNPGVAAMVRHHRLLYADLAEPLALLRGERADTALGDYWSYATAAEPAGAAAERVADYSELMSVSQPFVAAEVLAAVSLKRCRRLLDVGGGQGTFLIAAGRRWPHLQLALFDLPAVAERGRRRLEEAGLGARSTVTGGSFLTDAVPGGADVISLVRVIHDHDDADAARILARVREALEPGGRLLLAEPMAGTRGAEPVGDAYFGLYLFAMRSGRPRTVEELRSLLGNAGFTRIRAVPTRVPLLTRVIVAERTRT